MGKKAANPQPPPPVGDDSQPGAPALDASASPPPPEEPEGAPTSSEDPPPTWAELHAMADMLERFGARLLQVEDRVAKMAVVLRQNYGVKL